MRVVKMAPVAGRKVALLKRPLLRAAFAIIRHFGLKVGPISAAFDKGIPRLHAFGLEGRHEVPKRGPGNVVGETRIPGDGDAERQMLVKIEVAVELPFHEGKRPCDGGAGCFDLVDRMGRLELDPVDAGLVPVSPQPRDRVLQRAVGGSRA